MYRILMQRAVRKVPTPSLTDIRTWAQQTLQGKMPTAELTVRIVSINEITRLNTTYRHKAKPTNVLSFPFETPPDVTLELPLLGDIVICAEVVNQEAAAQSKEMKAHWAHMIIHGTLHLLGYDHEDPKDADIMENEEIKILKKIGFANPYV